MNLNISNQTSTFVGILDRFNNYFGIDCKIGQNVVFNNLKRFFLFAFIELFFLHFIIVLCAILNLNPVNASST